MGGLKITARSPWVTFETDEDIVVNLDGESRSVSSSRVGCHKGALPVHLGHNLLLRTTDPTDDGWWNELSFPTRNFRSSLGDNLRSN